MLFGFKQPLEDCNKLLQKGDHLFASQYIDVVKWNLILIILGEKLEVEPNFVTTMWELPVIIKIKCKLGQVYTVSVSSIKA